MDTYEAIGLARQLINEHGLTGWVAQLDRAKSRFGACKYSTRTISLSEPLVRLNTEDRVRQTILHEIAHALVGKSAGHGPIWQAKARSLGIPPNRCFSESDTVTPPSRYAATCATCGHEYKRERMPRREVACSKCCGGKFDRRYLLHFVTRSGRPLREFVAAEVKESDSDRLKRIFGT